MALCENCVYYRKEYDEFRQNYNDVIIVDDPEPEQHYCPMYDDNIPNAIYHKGAECEYYNGG